MDINEAFPSKYISHTDLQGVEHTLTIHHVEQQTLGNDLKPIMYFTDCQWMDESGRPKGMVMNKTNANTVKDILGPVTENWMGQKVVLFTVWTEYQGKQVQGMRLRMAPAVAAQASIAPTTAPVAQPAAAAYQPPAQPAPTTAPATPSPVSNEPPPPTAAPVGPTNQGNQANLDPNAPLEGRWP